MHNTVNFVFNILNLLVRIALVVYITRRYVIPRVAQAIQMSKESLRLIDLEQQKIKDECAQTNQVIKEQEKVYDAMQQNMIAWQDSVSALQMQQQQQCDQEQALLQQKIDKKRHYIQQRYLLKKEVPEILQQVQQQLQQEFKKDKNLGKSYITKVIQALK